MDNKKISTSRGDFNFYYKKQTSHEINIHFAHATGFNGITYRHFLNQFENYANVYAWDARGHGLTQADSNVQNFNDWSLYYFDLWECLKSISGPIFLTGHSMGATISLYTAWFNQFKPIDEQLDIRGVFLIEPVILNPFILKILDFMEWVGYHYEIPLAAIARKRREFFATKDEIFQSYHKKKLFSSWPPQILNDYIEGGFHKEEQSMRLNCSPQWESRSFSLTCHKPWQRLKETTTPVWVAYAKNSEVFGKVSEFFFKKYHPDGKTFMYPNASHSLPMEEMEDLKLKIDDMIQRYGKIMK